MIQMTDSSLSSLRDEWKRNPRLRLGTLAVAGILLLYLFLVVSDYQREQEKQYDQLATNYLKLKKGGLDESWIQNYEDAKALASMVDSRLWRAKSRGLAQAMVQAWAEGLIAKYHFASPALRVEQAYVVVGVDSIWQVAANLQADTPPEDVAGMLREIEGSDKLISIERLLITENGQSVRDPKRFTLSVKAYFKLEDSKE